MDMAVPLYEEISGGWVCSMASLCDKYGRKARIVASTELQKREIIAGAPVKRQNMIFASIGVLIPWFFFFMMCL